MVHGLDHYAQVIRVRRQQRFQSIGSDLSLPLDHDALPFDRIGDVQHYPHTMTTGPQPIYWTLSTPSQRTSSKAAA